MYTYMRSSSLADQQAVSETADRRGSRTNHPRYGIVQLSFKIELNVNLDVSLSELCLFWVFFTPHPVEIHCRRLSIERIRIDSKCLPR